MRKIKGYNLSKGPGEKLKESCRFDDAENQDIVNIARNSLREVSWGNIQRWNPSANDIYNYSGGGPFQRLAYDLTLLAKKGRKLYNKLGSSFTGGRTALQTSGRKPDGLDIYWRIWETSYR